MVMFISMNCYLYYLHSVYFTLLRNKFCVDCDCVKYKICLIIVVHNVNILIERILIEKFFFVIFHFIIII